MTLIQKYYQKCGHLQNTIILVQTDKNKILGGYTPLKFNPDNNNDYNDYFCDDSGSSFLFSLTNNDKFQLKQKQQAIYRSRDQQWIGFGSGSGCTFTIQDRANSNKDTYFYLNYETYVNYNYSHNKQSYLKLTGYQNKHFKVKEWEVHQILFQ